MKIPRILEKKNEFQIQFQNQNQIIFDIIIIFKFKLFLILNNKKEMKIILKNEIYDIADLIFFFF